MAKVVLAFFYQKKKKEKKKKKEEEDKEICGLIYNSIPIKYSESILSKSRIKDFKST